MKNFALSSLLEALGDGVSRNLLPLVAVAALGGGSASVGLLNSLGLLAFLFLSLPVGALGDRVASPLSMMTVSSLVRAGLAFGAVLAWATGALERGTGLVLLIGIALLIGVADVVYSTGQGLLVPRLVGKDELRSTFGVAQTTAQVGAAAGPLLLASVTLWMAPPSAWMLPGLMYLASVTVQTRMRKAAHRGSPASDGTKDSIWKDAREGVALVFRSRLLRAVTVNNCLINATTTAGNTVLPVLVLMSLGLPAPVFAAIGALGSVAGVAGAACGSVLTKQFGIRRVRLVASGCQMFGVAGVAVSLTAGHLLGPTIAWVALQAIVAGAGTAIIMVSGADIPARATPREKLGATMGAQRLMVIGIMPLSALIVGVIDSATAGAGVHIWAALAMLTVASTFLIRDLPGQETQEGE